jgi:hypothetical protein
LPELKPTDAAFWKGEVTRSRRVAEVVWPDWQTNLDYYAGRSPDAASAVANKTEWVNVNVDFYQVEAKQAQLFYETPDLQLTAKGAFKPVQVAGQPPPPLPPVAAILQAHRSLLNELLGPDSADVLTTIQKAIKDCLCPSGCGATKIGYEPYVQSITPPEQLGNVLNLNQSFEMPIAEKWYWDRISPKKYRIPADFHDTDYDKAPWLGMDFRMPLAEAKRQFTLPADFNGNSKRDEKVLTDHSEGQDTSDMEAVEGTEIWYYASLYDDDVIHPQLMRRHVLVEGVEGFVEKDNESPYQTLLNGRLSRDSMIGNPIHVLTLRDVPDSAYVPSDCQMTRPLVRELCKFRTQMVQEREATRPRFGFDVDKLTPPDAEKLANGTLGEFIALEGGALAGGAQSIVAQLIPGTANRQAYIANDYITRDIEKTLAIDSSGAGVSDSNDETATKTAEVARSRNVRIDAERRRVLMWYLKGVQKFSALVCRFMTPSLAVPYLGEQGAQVWASWDKQATDGRLVFDARPDSQIRLDSAQERRFALQLYQMTANDPNVVRVKLLKSLFEKYGLDPTEMVVDQLPEKGPDGNFSMRFQGDDLIAPQAQQVREVLAQLGVKISQPAIDSSGSQMYQQVALGLRNASGKAVSAQPRPAEHGGPAEQVRPLSKKQGDETGNRPGPGMEE